MSVAVASSSTVRFQPYGAIAKLFQCQDPEVGLDGPAGTGKSRGVLEKVHLALNKYPGARGLMVRKTRKSLTQSGMETFETKVLSATERARTKFSDREQAWMYPNKSILAVSGMDDPQKIMSSEWDIIYEQEGTELTLEDHETLTIRCRNGIMPYNQVISDCNPSYPNHWWLQRTIEGKMTRFPSRHEDNPVYWDRQLKTWTAKGKAYILGVLENLSGVRYKRLRLGKWVAAEGIVYDEWDSEFHMIKRFRVPTEWPRIWGVDFGFTNPFVWGDFAIDPDGRLILVHQIYRTGRIVEDHCKIIRNLKLPKPSAVICDHDIEDRRTFEKYTDTVTIPAYKDLATGIQAMKQRLRRVADDEARLLIMRDSLVENPDPELFDKRLPHAVEQEFESYIWDDSPGKQLKELPVKKFDHGMDLTRYVVAHADRIGRTSCEIRSFD